MQAIDYLRVLRHRWKIVLGCLLAALIAGFATAPATANPQNGATATSYVATHTLILSPDMDLGSLNLSRVKLLIVTGEIPKAVARSVGYDGSGAQLATLITVTDDPEVGTVAITMTDSDPQRATRYANSFAKETLRVLRRNAVDAQRSKLTLLRGQLDQVAGEVNALEVKTAQAPDDALLKAQLDAQTARYQGLFQEYETVRAQTPTGGLTTLDAATPVPIASGGVFTAPQGRTGRLALAGVIGLLLGLGGALSLDRLDTRLRSRNAVETTFRLPVLTEVPQINRTTRRNRRLIVVTDPSSAPAEAYRSLRSAMLLLPSMVLPRPISIPDEAVRGGTSAAPKVILVTSAAPREGKTTTLANLAASLGEAGKTVLVLDCDFRQGDANRYFDVTGGGGLSDLLLAGAPNLLSADRPDQLDMVRQVTAVPGVTLVTSGSTGYHPSAFLGGMPVIIEQARKIADFVLIDSSPALGANDTVDLMPHVDSVLITCRYGRTGQEMAKQMSELLARLQVPALGVAMVATPRRRLQTSGTMFSVPSLVRRIRPGSPSPLGGVDVDSRDDPATDDARPS
jgi:Mrp family chromosome partitioning ATPase/capsular polysaccharide biosynthesis protein